MTWYYWGDETTLSGTYNITIYYPLYYYTVDTVFHNNNQSNCTFRVLISSFLFLIQILLNIILNSLKSTALSSLKSQALNSLLASFLTGFWNSSRLSDPSWSVSSNRNIMPMSLSDQVFLVNVKIIKYVFRSFFYILRFFLRFPELERQIRFFAGAPERVFRRYQGLQTALLWMSHL